jgi:hypothetical protein
VERRSLPCRINPAQESLDFGGDRRLHPADLGFGVAAAHLDGIRVCRMFIARSYGSLYPGIFPRTTIRSFAFIAGEQTFGYLKSMRSKPFPVRHVRMGSSSV